MHLPRVLRTLSVCALLSQLLCIAAFAQAAAPAAPPKPEPTLEQRVAGLEAYLQNTDPSAPLKVGPKDKDGNPTIPAGLTTASVGVPGPGHNAWMMTSAALVLFMTLPGLALFYGGLVRTKNVLSVMAQCLLLAGLVTILWWAFGYSLVFGKSFNSPYLGGTEFFFLKGVDGVPNTDYAAWVSQNVFAMYQLMFAIITPGLIVGAIAERMRYPAIMAFIVVWMFVVYFPLAHMVWGIDGFMNGVWNAGAGIKAIDFAGGTVVHMSSGWSALVLCLILGKRQGFGQRPFLPHSLVLTMVGTGMLWVGWYGFNAGSAVAADGIAANAFTATTLATAVAASTWPTLEWVTRGKPSAGFVSPSGAVIIGVLAGAVPYFACTKLKSIFNYDDALDTFGVHGVGGTLGALLTGVFATADVNPNLNTNLGTIVGHTLWLEQLKAIGLTMTLAIGGTVVIAYAVKALIGLRPDKETEEMGLDALDHGEAGYHHEEAGGMMPVSMMSAARAGQKSSDDVRTQGGLA
jgi:Amt family ammonium transporter